MLEYRFTLQINFKAHMETNMPKIALPKWVDRILIHKTVIRGLPKSGRLSMRPSLAENVSLAYEVFLSRDYDEKEHPFEIQLIPQHKQVERYLTHELEIVTEDGQDYRELTLIDLLTGDL